MRKFTILAHATTRLVSLQVDREACSFPGCAIVEVNLLLANDEKVLIFRNPPIFLSQEGFDIALSREYTRRRVHPRVSHLMLEVKCLTRRDRCVRYVQENELRLDSRLEIDFLPLTEAAKRMASQVKCWYLSHRDSILGRHFLAGLFAAHLFDDVKVFMEMFPSFSKDFPLMFINGPAGFNFRKFVYCRGSSWIFDQPRLVLLTRNSHPDHSHRLRCHLKHAEGTVIEGPVIVEKLPLSIIMKLPMPLATRPVLSQGEDAVPTTTCPVVQKRRFSFNIALFFAVSRLAGKMLLAKKRRYTPGSKFFMTLKSKYADVPVRKFWYLGYEDLQRSKRQRYRKQKIRLAHRTVKKFSISSFL